MTRLRKTIFFFAFFFVLSASTFAVVVNSAKVAGNQLTITGTGFSGIPLVVTFNGKGISVVSSTSTQIVATLNPAPTPGSYRLVVKAGTASTSSYVSVPTAAILFGECSWAQGGGWVWLFGGGGCGGSGWHYPPGQGIPLTSAGILSNLRAEGQFDGTVTVWINDVETSLSCTIINNTGYKSTCTDVIHKILVNAGDEVALGINGSNISAARAAFEFRFR